VHSIRFRLGAVLAAASVLLVVVFGLLVSGAALAGEREQLRDEAAASLRSSTASYVLTGQAPSDTSLGRSGVPRALVSALSPGDRGTYDDGNYMWAATLLDGREVLSTRLSNDPVRERWQSLRTSIIQIAAAVVAIAWVAGWAVAERLTVRLRLTAEAARRVSGGDLASRARVGGRDEIAMLARSVDTMTDTLLAQVERERRLTADTAHELRTPLTALVSSVELLDESAEADRVRSQVARLRHLVDDLLRLARLEHDGTEPALASADLATQVRDVVDALPERDDCTMTVNSSTPVLLDPVGFRHAVGNLVANAARHGTGPIEITVTSNQLTITDRGPGFPEDILTNGPRRFRSSGPRAGTGLGLTIVQHELQAMEGTLTLTNTAHGFACCQLTFARPSD
jgi:two-component system sensor histidine kinase MtrB